MKKTLSVLLCFILALGTAVTGAGKIDSLFDLIFMKAAAAASGKCGENLTWDLSDSGVLRISGSGKMAGFSEDLPPWDSYSESVKQVIIENGVTSVGASAFFVYAGIESVTLPDTLVSVGDFAFCGCSIKSIEMPGSVTGLGEGVFQGCGKLQNVKLSNSLTSINSFSFSGCSNLKEIIIPDNVKTICQEAFAQCSGLKSLTLSKNISEIQTGAFYGCNALKYVFYDRASKDRQNVKIYEHNEKLENALWHYKNPNIIINVAGPRSVNERTNVFIVATAENVPKGSMIYMEIYQNGSMVDKWFTESTEEINIPVFDVRSDIDYTVGVCDKEKTNLTDENGNAIRVKGGKITVKSVGFFQKIVLFFKALFNNLPEVTVKP